MNTGTLAQIQRLKQLMSEGIIGQEAVLERLIIAILANGNILMEGLPGLAKTRAIKTLSKHLESKFSRVQFTPDLLPADITGTEIYYQKPGDGGAFEFQPGPIFANLVLADEINRAPAKVQSALLEAMEERQVTVAGKTHKLPGLFMVLATQNPIEQEGTYPLPEAQRDRFLMHINVRYSSDADEAKIMRLVRSEETAANNQTINNNSAQPPAPATRDTNVAQAAKPAPLTTQTPPAPPPSTGAAAPSEKIPQSAVFDARAQIASVQLSESIEKYIVTLIAATRRPADFSPDLAKWIHVGGSPRATLAIDRASRARAWLNGRDHVLPDDVRAIAPDCLRHRLLLSYEANADGKSTDDIIKVLLETVALA